jgi:hypothetical protein
MNIPRHAELGREDVRRVLQLRREVEGERRKLARAWNARLHGSGLVEFGSSDNLIVHLCTVGGFRFPLPALPSIRPSLVRDFLSEFGLPRSGWLHTRGYDYYSADTTMHLPSRLPSEARRLSRLATRWANYDDLLTSMAGHAARRPLRLHDWLALIGVLEWMLNDAWTVHWAWCCRAGGQPDRELDAVTRTVTQAIVEIAWKGWNAAGDSAEARLWEARDAVRTDAGFAAKLTTLQHALARCSHDPGWLRAVREGDQLWSVFASFERKAATVLARHPGARVVVASEAFGAIHCGLYWLALATEADRARMRTITTRMSIHEEEMGRAVAGCRSSAIALDEPVVLHVDDSVFTGRTHELFRQMLVTEPQYAYLAALTIDLGTPLNHPAEMTWDGRSPGEHIEYLSRLGRSCDGRLPPLLSFWACRRAYPAATGDADSDYLAARAGGSDRLLAALWGLFREQILHD